MIPKVSLLSLSPVSIYLLLPSDALQSLVSAVRPSLRILDFRYDLEKLLFSDDTMVQRRAFVLLVEMDFEEILNGDADEFKEWTSKLARLEPLPSDARLKAVIAGFVAMLRDEAHYRDDDDAGNDIDPSSFEAFIDSMFYSFCSSSSVACACVCVYGIFTVVRKIYAMVILP